MSDRPDDPFIPGQRIRVVDGPLKGFNGVVVEDDDCTNRLTVELMVFGHATRASVTALEIEADE